MDSISNNDNMSNILDLNNSINITSNCKQFHFSRSDIDSIINCFGMNTMTRADI